MKNIFLTLLMTLIPLMAWASTYEITTPGNNVGIGSTAPGQALDVNGDVQTNANVDLYNAKVVGQIFGTSDSGGLGSIELYNPLTQVSNGFKFVTPYASTTVDNDTDWTLSGSSPVGAIKLAVYEDLTVGESHITELVDNRMNAAASNLDKIGLELTSEGNWTNGMTGNRDILLYVTGAGVGNENYFIDDISGRKSSFAGNIGIGSTAPGQKLDVQGTVRIYGNLGIGLATAPDKLDINGSGVIGNGYAGTYSPPSNSLIVQTNVGIGSYAPTQALDAGSGNIKTSGSFLIGTQGQIVNSGNNVVFKNLNNDGTAGFVFNAYQGNSGSMDGFGDWSFSQIGTSATTAFMIGNNSNLRTNASTVASISNVAQNNSTGSVNKTALSIITSGTWSGASDGTTNEYGINLSLGANANNNYSIYSSTAGSKMYHAGNVGIGSTNPGQMLDVQGTVRAIFSGTCSYLYKCVGGVDAGVIQTSACNLCPGGSCTQMAGCF